MRSASASESSGVIGPTSRRIRPRLSSSRVRSTGSSGRSGVRASTSVKRLSLRGRLNGSAHREQPVPPSPAGACLRVPLRPAQPLAARGFVHRRQRRARRQAATSSSAGLSGSTREARTNVVEVQPPSTPRRPRRARRGTVGAVAWTIRPEDGGSLVSLVGEGRARLDRPTGAAWRSAAGAGSGGASRACSRLSAGDSADGTRRARRSAQPSAAPTITSVR